MNKNFIYHLTFWGFYILLWSAHDFVYYPNFLSNIRTNLYEFVPYILLVYFNLYVLMPRFLLKKKIKLYVFLVLFCIALTTIISSKSLIYFYENIRTYKPRADFLRTFQGNISILTDLLILVSFTMTLFLLKEWYHKERYTQEIEKKTLETELMLLKNQLNPHFLFNALNSIYIMMGRNLEKGKIMLLEFSDILSHQLYETNKEKVPLTKELDNIKNYINIEKIRHEDIAKVNIEFNKIPSNLYLPPMLLLPLVENAFKHGQSSSGYKVNIKAKIIENTIFVFEVENSFDGSSNKKCSNGIGLVNLKRRLELLYPNHHSLEINNENSIFKVTLKTELYGS